MLQNPKIYELNTRVWIKQFETGTTLSNIPDKFFNNLAELGIDILWPLGVWEICPQLIEQCCFSPDLVSTYSKSLKDWKKEDVIGSPFAINDYDLNPLLGKTDDLKKLHETLNQKGMKLILDFVPNHFSACSKLIKTNPDIFLTADEDLLSKDSYTFLNLNIVTIGYFVMPGIRFFLHGRIQYR